MKQKKKYTQDQLVFGFLYDNRHRWIKPWELIGEKYIAGQQNFISYKGPTRLSEVFDKANIVIKRKKIKGKSGSTFFIYRFFESGLMYDFLPQRYFAILADIDEHRTGKKRQTKNKIF
jgi:hypothetical protein